MKIIIDTSNKNLFIALMINNKIVKYKLIKNLIKKVDVFSYLFVDLIQKIPVTKINDFYVTIGPGSFTGSRIALVFARTICQLTNANLHTTTSIQLIAGPKGTHDIFLDARSNQSYYCQVKNGKLVGKIKLVPSKPSTKHSYQNLLKTPKEYLSLFKLEKNILKIQPYYVKKPKIG